MSQDRSPDRTDDDRAPDFYLPGTPDPSTIDRIWNAIGWLFRPRGRVRGERPRGFRKR